MQYFVSAENIAYHHWQLELLIESFKMHNLQDSLVIGLAANTEPIYSEPINLSSHKNVFIHDNVGKEKNCPSFNRAYGLYVALNKDLIKAPLTILHPDTILVKPLELKNIDVTFQIDPDFTIERSKSEEFLKNVKEAKNIKEDLWLPLGDTICFEKLPDDLVKRVLKITDYLTETHANWEDAEKTGWALTLLEYYGHLSYYGTVALENTLLDTELKSFIHYRRGLPPYFNKHMFHFEPPTIFSMGDPYDILLKYNANKVMDYVGKVINSYRSK
jgi:hypothetical protein